MSAAGGENRAGRVLRRQVTVLFCDLVDSAELATRIDPEALRDVLRVYLGGAAERIEAEGGFVARYMGDGLLAYFGFPHAHEDDAARAIRAARAVTALGETSAPPHGVRLKLRAGIATGVSVVGDLLGRGEAQERSIIGPAPNLAARLQALASPGGVMVCETTRELAGAAFLYEDQGAVRLKGFAEPPRVFAVTGEALGVSRFRARSGGTVAPLIGRAAEIDALTAAFERAASGETVVAAVTGEPGMGKSRLVYELRRRIAMRDHLWLEAGASPSSTATPFHAIGRMIRARLGVASDGLTVALLNAALDAAGIEVRDGVPALMRLLEIDSAPSAQDDPEAERIALFGLLEAWLRAQASVRPVVVVLEDLQWADPSTIELLQRLARFEAERLLIVTTARADFAPDWHFSGQVHEVALSRLGADDIVKLADAVAPTVLDAAQLDELASRADGVPLFAETLARGGAMASDGPPPTLAALLETQLERTGEFAADLARVASVLGREFEISALSAISGLDDAALASGLAALTAAGTLSVEGDQAVFRHALIQEQAYGSLLTARRAMLHVRAARYFDAASVRRPELLARHWRAAGEPFAAVERWQEAARAAKASRAYAEAEEACREALATLAEAPEGKMRDEKELTLQAAYADVLQITRGYSTPDAMRAGEAARRLAERGGDVETQFTQGAAAWMAASSAGDYEVAMQLAERLTPLAALSAARENAGIARMIEMTTRYRCGELAAAEALFVTGRADFDAPEFARRPGAIPQTFGNAAVNIWILGDIAAARRRTTRVIAAGGAGENPYAAAFAFYMAAMQYVLMGDADEGARLARESMAISDREAFPQFAATARVVLGRAEVDLGRPDVGVTLIAEGLQRMDGTRSRAGRTMYTTWLAEAHAASGDGAAALAVLDRTLEDNPRERFFRPETLRLRAALRLDAGDAEGGRADLDAAIALARSIGAALFLARARATQAALDRAAA